MNEQVRKHEVILPLVDDKYILFNGLYGAIDAVDQQTADIIRDAQQSNTQPIGLDADMHERLVRRGHLVERQTEADDLKILSRLTLHFFDQNAVDLVMMPTYNCNFRCTYCSERHRLTRGQAWLERVMSPEIIAGVFEQMKKYREQGKKLGDCTLYGGEPLLASNIETVRNICEHCRDMGMKIDAITNGYDLEHYLDLIDEFKFDSLQITLDGVGKMHDRRRPSIDGGSSYERIIKNVGLALERGIKINLRINVDRRNLDNLSKLIEEFKAHGFIDKPNFSYYCKAVLPGTSPDPADELTDVDVLAKLKELVLDEEKAFELDTYYSSNDGTVKKMLERKTYSYPKAAHCGAESGMMVIDASGQIYPCWGAVGNDARAIGRVDTELNRFRFNLEMPKWRTRRVHNLEGCRECPYVMQCGGGCADLVYRHYGTLKKGFCDEFKAEFDHVLQFECREAWAKDRTVEMSKSWRESLSRIDEDERQTLTKTTDPKQTLDIWKKHTTPGEIFGGGD
ncbi:MAG: radical SAM protein [Selenomonadaceae bacterium]|nr:radical SAM protein [Selenomonadaceae bacterium]